MKGSRKKKKSYNVCPFLPKIISNNNNLPKKLNKNKTKQKHQILLVQQFA